MAANERSSDRPPVSPPATNPDSQPPTPHETEQWLEETTGDPIDPYLADITPFLQEMRETLDKLVRDRSSRGDVKLVRTALKELRYSFKVLAKHRHRRKVSVFGSARTPAQDPSYQTAVAFGREIARAGFMVITGAASGIMEAGHIGAGRDASIGLNIILPFEQKANPVIEGDKDRLMHLKYFFTRKLLFMKESHAVILFPGGFGTLDEGFEALTLIQTGKNPIIPLVLLEEPGGTYWQHWTAFVQHELLDRGMISAEDTALYTVTHSVAEAVEEVVRFYRVFHSMRYVRKDLALRLHHPLSETLLEQIRDEFADIVENGTFRQLTEAHPGEAQDEHIRHLPRLLFRFNRHNHGRLRILIDLINRAG